MQDTRRSVITGTAVFLGSALAGCIGDEDDFTEDDHDDADDHDDDHGDGDDGYVDELGIYELQLYDRAHDPAEELSYMHEDHWHGTGAFPIIPLGEHLSIGASAEDEDGNEIDIGGEFALQAVEVDEAGYISVDSHGDHVHIHGEDEGVTEVLFQLWHDDHVDYQSKPLSVTISEDDDHEHGEFDAHHVDAVTILDRAPEEHEKVANWHEDHWDGELPVVPTGNNISLGAVFEDEAGNEADLDHDYEVRARIADDATELVMFEYHGDHLHVIGDGEEGTTEIVFQLWHDDHADFETTPVDVTIEE